MKYGLIGEKLGHSFSKDIHSEIADYNYELLELKSEELEQFFKRRDFLGINITLPYKQKVMGYLDEIDSYALEIGAVNTVVNECGKLKGYNTDIDGLCALINRNVSDLKGKKVLICGTGGTSHTASAAVRKLGGTNTVVVSRNDKSGCVTYEQAYHKHADADIIINTTPCGMWPDVYSCAADTERFKNLSAVIDVVYNPLRTQLVTKARAKGIKAEGGLYMLVAQAVAASEKFTSQKYDHSLCGRIYKRILFKKENIVLIGMPGSGKTTLARKLADSTGRAFYDTDEMIAEKTGLSPSEIISRYSEQAFRKIESEVIGEVALHSSAVIATGGGAVLDQTNIDKLKMNGKIVFVDREFEKLKAFRNRPLSSTKDKLTILYKERLPLYCARSDLRFKPCDTPEASAKNLLEILENEDTDN